MSSKFAAVLAAKRDVQDTEPTPRKVSPGPRKAPKPVVLTESAPTPRDSQSNHAKRRGRPNAKRSDPDYVQGTVYIKKQTHKDVKRALIDEEKDFSELVEELLSQWLNQNI